MYMEKVIWELKTYIFFLKSISDTESFWRNKVRSGRAYEQNKTESQGP